MSKIAVVTDSNSGITQERGKELGIFVLPMPFYIDGELYFEDISLTQEDFYKKLQEDADISTSQPSPGDLMDFWENILKEYDEIVHIPMSSGLSGSCQTAMTLADDYDGKVHVVDNQRISVTQEQSVYDAMALIKAGKISRGDQTDPGRRETGSQHLYYGRYTEISKKRRTHHSGSGSAWLHVESEACITTPGRKARFLCKGAGSKSSKKNDAQSD